MVGGSVVASVGGVVPTAAEATVVGTTVSSATVTGRGGSVTAAVEADGAVVAALAIATWPARRLASMPVTGRVPERMTTLTTAPPTRPYSALKLLVMTLNSATASGEGCATWLENPWLLVE